MEKYEHLQIELPKPQNSSSGSERLRRWAEPRRGGEKAWGGGAKPREDGPLETFSSPAGTRHPQNAESRFDGEAATSGVCALSVPIREPPQQMSQVHAHIRGRADVRILGKV